MKRSFNAKNFQVTIQENDLEHYERIKEYLLGFEPNYFYSCIEENKRGSLHMHIYVQYPKCKRLTTNKIHPAHLEVCYGTPQQNKDYIDKIKRAYNTNNIIDEMGAIRLGGIKSNLAISLMEKELEEVQINEFKTWKEINAIKSFKKKDIYKPEVKVFYIYGESGVGKTKKVFEMLGEDEEFDRIKYANGYWIGVNHFTPATTAWYDDFRDSQMPAAEFINLIDYYKNQMNLKYCSSHINQYKKIYITSVQTPDDIYRNLDKREQWIRRLTKIHMEEDGTTTITEPDGTVTITHPTDD